MIWDYSILFQWLAGITLLLSLPLLVVLGMWRVTGIAKQGNQQRALTYLESAVRMHAPLATMIQAAAESEAGRFGMRLWKCAQELVQGASLHHALGLVPDVSQRNRAYLGAAERSGQLAVALPLLVERERNAEKLMSRTIEWVYPLGIFSVLLGVLSLFLGGVAPKFYEIFADFDTQLPDFTQTVFFGFGMKIVALGMIVLCLVVGVILFMMTMLTLTRMWGARLPEFVTELAGFGMFFVRRLPILRRLTSDRAWADVCVVIAMNLHAAIPLGMALTEAQQLPVDAIVRFKLKRWEDAMDRGEDVASAARKAALPRLIVGMLGTGQASAHAAETFDFLHRYYDSQYSRTLELLRGAIVPVGVLLMGTLVGTIVVGLMLPLNALIRGAMGGVNL